MNKNIGMEYTEFEAEMLRDKEIRKAYEALEPKYQMIRAIIKRRNKLKISQTELARKVGTKQPAISRLERGDCNTSLDTLYKVTSALGLAILVAEPSRKKSAILYK
jgi:DNA-binding XRE family transcriptional regulator